MLLRRLSLLALIVLLAAPGVMAQDIELSETYDDGKITFQYPARWQVTEREEFIFISGRDRALGTVSVAFYFPEVINSLVGNPRNLARALDDLLAKNFDFDASESQVINSDTGRGTAAAIIQSKTSELGGFAFLVEMSTRGDYGFMLTFTDQDEIENSIPLVVAILNTYDTSTGGGKDDGGDNGGGGSIFDQVPGSGGQGGAVEWPESLRDFDRGWEDAVAELQDAGVIGDGGLVFEEDRAFFDGVGSWFTALGQGRPFTDVVMAGELNFTVGSTREYEACALMARVQGNSRGASIFLQVGLDNEGRAYYFDAKAEGEAEGFILADNVDIDRPHHFLFIVQKETLTVYMDGELIATDQAVENRSGSYGVFLLGKGRSSRCEATNMWVYQAPAPLGEGVCEISTTRNVNKRTGPGTNFGQSGQLRAGSAENAVAFAFDRSGNRWWKLEDDTWVREDVVTATGDCENLPEED